MAKSRDPIDELSNQAEEMPDGPAKTAILEEAVRMADTHGDLPRAFEIRQELITSATFGGQPDVAIVHFSWCLAQFDEDPERFDEHDLLWKYKWIVAVLPNFPQISRKEIERILDDIEERYRCYGSTMHSIYNKRRSVAMDMGDVKAAKKAHAKMRKTRRDSLSDCKACIADEMVVYLRFLNQNTRAVNEGIKLIKSNLCCSEVPDTTYSLLLVPLLKLHRAKEAMKYHQIGYRLNARDPDRLAAVNRHIEFLALTDNFADAVKLVQKHLPMALSTVDQHNRFEFYRVAWLVFERLRESGKDSIKLRMPANFSLALEGGKYQTDQIAKGFHDLAHEIALRFDVRNGNDFYRRKLTDTTKLKKYATPFPIAPQK
jgi:hypothetical protein